MLGLCPDDCRGVKKWTLLSALPMGVSDALRLGAAGLMAVLAGACASTGAIPRPFPQTAQRASPPAAVAPQVPNQASVVSTALALRGTPYRNGGADPMGFDCSGFTQYVFFHHGTALPRDVRGQFDRGAMVSRSEIAAGDLVFFQTTGRGPTHVGIAVGGGQFVHAPSTSGVVRVERMDVAYWTRRYVGARRVAALQAALN